MQRRVVHLNGQLFLYRMLDDGPYDHAARWSRGEEDTTLWPKPAIDARPAGVKKLPTDYGRPSKTKEAASPSKQAPTVVTKRASGKENKPRTVVARVKPPEDLELTDQRKENL